MFGEYLGKSSPWQKSKAKPIKLLEQNEKTKKDYEKHMFPYFSLFWARFLTRFLARVLTRVLGGKNTVHSTTWPKENTLKT